MAATLGSRERGVSGLEEAVLDTEIRRLLYEVTVQQRHERNERGRLPRCEGTAFQENRNTNLKVPEMGL